MVEAGGSVAHYLIGRYVVEVNMFNIFKGKSRAQRVQARLESGAKSSDIAIDVASKVTPKKYNTLIKKAVAEYNREHDRKVFSE
ncbi:TPA: hypothetical protein I7662_20820 [Vibrio vulnificus]|nr:hypothetical protein [Vibrio vulnificus]